MKWANVKLIYARELRDQLRDRRTLFTVLILPLLLYPLMGIAMLQVSQFMREYPTRIWLVGAENLPDTPALLCQQEINPKFLDTPTRDLIEFDISPQDDSRFQRLIDQFKSHTPQANTDSIIDQLIQIEMKQRNVDLAVVIPQPIAKSFATPPEVINLKRIFVFRNSASDKSNIAAERFNLALTAWKQDISRNNLKKHGLDPAALLPFSISQADVANRQNKSAALWSKILPFIIVIWCLTGAFYPAVDLCAGEKERGTFETLLSSPALRDEIAIGKLLTVISFSIVTCLLNLISMGFTGIFVASRLGQVSGAVTGIGFPPLESLGWLLLALVPISALFRAVAMAAASFALSSKEGQYYLVPLMMISMPLMMLPMLPAAKLDLGTSLIPVSGLMLLLRGLIEGQYQESAPYAGPVCAVTLICCWLAVRWVVKQFNNDSVLFRPSERFGLGAWLRQLMRERNDLPGVGHAVLCGVVILVLKFFIGMMVDAPTTWYQFSKQTVIVLIATVGTPAVLMSIVLTRKPMQSLRLQKTSLSMLMAGLLLAICLHPLIMWITSIVIQLYPPTGDIALMQQMMKNIVSGSPGIWATIAVIALTPALIEELAFRGFILSGMQSLRSDFKAIVFTSLLFGVAHAIFQQSIVTFFVGCILGFIAIRTSSIFPCILYHATHNSISVLLAQTGPSATDGPLGWLLTTNDGTHIQYSFWPAALLTGLGILLLVWIWQSAHPNRNHDTPVDATTPFGEKWQVWLNCFLSRPEKR